MNTFSKQTKILIFSNIIALSFILVIEILLSIYFYNKVSFWYIFINLLALLIEIFIIVFNLINYRNILKNLETEKNYNESLTSLNDSIRGFKHDFENIINIISGYIQINDMDGLKKYFIPLQNECKEINTVEILNPNIINDPGIYNLLITKYKRAKDFGITFNIEFFFNFDNLAMPVYELSRMLGILFDNAIEASKDSDEKLINVVFRESQRQKVQFIIIENTYSEQDLDINKIFEKGISGKEKHSGIGLWEVKNIVTKNHNVILNTSKDDKYFKQELQIYY